MSDKNKKPSPSLEDEESSSGSSATLVRPAELLRSLEIEFGRDAPQPAPAPSSQIARPPRLAPTPPARPAHPLVTARAPGARPGAAVPRPGAGRNDEGPPQTRPPAPPRPRFQEPTGTGGTLIMKRPIGPELLEALEADVRLVTAPQQQPQQQQQRQQQPQPQPATRAPMPSEPHSPPPGQARPPMPSEPRAQMPSRPPMPSDPPQRPSAPPPLDPRPPMGSDHSGSFAQQRPSSPPEAPRLPLVAPLALPKNAGDWQQLWLSMQERPWKSLVVVSDAPSPTLLAVANALAAVGTEHLKQPIYVVDHRAVTLGEVESKIAELGAALANGARVIVVLDPITKNPAGLRFATKVDAALLCLTLGKADLAIAKKTMDAIGKQRFLGLVSLRAKP